MVEKIISLLFLPLVFIMMVNNAYYYPVNAGYDAMLHLKYAKIVSEEWRFPTWEETRENYNPPLFYLASGLVTRGYAYISDQDFFTSAKAWQYVNIVLAFASLYFWYRIIAGLYPKSRLIPKLFLFLLLSLPVLYKTNVMFSIETWFLFTVSLTFWFFLTRFRFKPNVTNAVVLGLLLIINLLSRLSAAALVAAIVAGIVGLFYQRKIKLSSFILVLVLLTSLLTAGSGWFYYGRRNEGIYGVGEGGEPETPLFKRQPLSFYVDVPFRLMMTYPMRQSTPINKLIPIYYSEFWGDFWNYFPQRRFGQSVTDVRKDRESSIPQRIKALSLQNQINLVPTVLMIGGFIWVIFRFLSRLAHPDDRWLTQGVMLVFTLLTWGGFLVLLTKFPSWKGDSIKASYMLSLLPIFVYFLIDLLVGLFKTKKILFWPLTLWLVLSGLINLSFSWF